MADERKDNIIDGVCNAFTQKGEKCTRICKDNNDELCWQHTPRTIYQFEGPQMVDYYHEFIIAAKDQNEAIFLAMIDRGDELDNNNIIEQYFDLLEHNPSSLRSLFKFYLDSSCREETEFNRSYIDYFNQVMVKNGLNVFNDDEITSSTGIEIIEDDEYDAYDYHIRSSPLDPYSNNMLFEFIFDNTLDNRDYKEFLGQLYHKYNLLPETNWNNGNDKYTIKELGTSYNGKTYYKSDVIYTALESSYDEIIEWYLD
jgi:hypothetical protein